MEKPIYQIESSLDGLYHIFESENEGRVIKKLVAYVKDEQLENRYHLIFGDLDDSNSLDVFAVSNNNDMVMVLSTVIKTLFEFFDKNPNSSVIFTGSTDARTRLYRAVIGKLFNKVSEYYSVKGVNTDGSIEEFDKSKQYQGYLISSKNEEE
ncbi:MAG: DUF6934 family protein [Spirosomataceae bacterium]